MIYFFILALVVIFVCLWLVGLYNKLVVVKNNAEKDLNNIDIVLKQRHDELPKLIDVCKGYMKYEQELLSKITALRTEIFSASGTAEKMTKDSQLSTALKSLFAVAENYPELKANQNFLQLQSRISDLENKIAQFRVGYNSSANSYNILIEQIPYSFMAGILNYTKKQMLAIPSEEKKDVKISF